MPIKELLIFRAALINLLIHRSRHIKRPVVPQSSSHSRDGVPMVFPSVELEKLAYREESVATAWVWAGIQFIKPPLPTLSVKFVSARFPVLQTITRTELYVVSCLFILDHVCWDKSFLIMRVGTNASHSCCSHLSTYIYVYVCMH